MHDAQNLHPPSPTLKAKGPIIFRQRVGSCQQEALVKDTGRSFPAERCHLGSLGQKTGGPLGHWNPPFLAFASPSEEEAEVLAGGHWAGL